MTHFLQPHISDTCHMAAGSTPRLRGVDLARGLAVLFMIWVHVLEVYGSAGVRASLLGSIVEFLGGPPAAPVFMLVMGLSFSYNSPKPLPATLSRGLKILAMGYLLNFARALPFMIAQPPMPDALAGAIPPEVDLLALLLLIDILQFAGLALIVMALIRRFLPHRGLIAALAALVAVAPPWLWGLGSGIPALGRVFDLLWGDRPVGGLIENAVAFPAFPWLAFPLAGMVAGDLLRGAPDTGRVMRRLALVGAALLAAGAGLTLTDPDYQFNDYYHSRAGAMILMTGFALLWLWGCHLAAQRIQGTRVFDVLARLSSNVTNVYCIQWTLIVWGIALWGMGHGLASTLLLMLAFTLASDLLSRLYARLAPHRTS